MHGHLLILFENALLSLFAPLWLAPLYTCVCPWCLFIQSLDPFLVV